MLSTDVRALSQLCKGDPLPLTLTNQISLELCEGSHHALEQVRHWRVFSGKGQVLLFKAYMNAAFCKSKDHLPKIVQVAGQPVHRVADHRITVANVRGELYEFRPVKVFARGLVDETLVERNALKLAQLFLIERADA